jgi:hypothetical protein
LQARLFVVPSYNGNIFLITCMVEVGDEYRALVRLLQIPFLHLPELLVVDASVGEKKDF